MKPKPHIHFIGIGGTGLSAIARVLLESGYPVSGSDRVLTPLSEELRQAGVEVVIGHHARNIEGADKVVRSSAIPDSNSEVKAALKKNIPVLKRSEFLGDLLKGRLIIAVAGTHGKTTTTAMIAWLFTALGQDPSYIIGGVSRNLAGNAHAGRGSVFVIEADEYDNMFLGLEPDIALVTNVEHDHPDFFPTPEDYRQAFVEFVGRIKPGGLLLSCSTDANSAGLMGAVSNQSRALSYGLTNASHYFISDLKQNEYGGMTFFANFQMPGRPSVELARVHLRVPGRHNVLNALAAMAVVHQFGLSMEDAAQAMQKFDGTGRRFDVRGEVNGITVIDDYAHHPTEIRATLQAARERFPSQRLWAVWQPHTYSRTRSLLEEFAAAFTQADQIIVSEIFAARESDPGFSAVEVVKKMSHPPALFIPSLEDISQHLLNNLRPGDVLLVLSAGDADQISAHVLRDLTAKGGSDA